MIKNIFIYKMKQNICKFWKKQSEANNRGLYIVIIFLIILFYFWFFQFNVIYADSPFGPSSANNVYSTMITHPDKGGFRHLICFNTIQANLSLFNSNIMSNEDFIKLNTYIIARLCKFYPNFEFPQGITEWMVYDQNIGELFRYKIERSSTHIDWVDNIKGPMVRSYICISKILPQLYSIIPNPNFNLTDINNNVTIFENNTVVPEFSHLKDGKFFVYLTSSGELKTIIASTMDDNYSQSQIIKMASSVWDIPTRNR